MLKVITMQTRRFSNLTNCYTLMQTCGSGYEGAVTALNKLVSNASYLKNIPKTVDHSKHRIFFERTGISWERLDSLSVIHVSGTKGKGSTSSMCENILRQKGFRTGLFSSPHLIEVRERIRINGRAIDASKFAAHFWKLYKKFYDQRSDDDDMPIYFKFLTLMAFQVFLEEKVDVAIIEVGIGGEFDCTNILRKVSVVGITPLGYDHTELLGDTIESIAWNKAGIMKEGCLAFSVPQISEAMEVLKKRSLERNCKLRVIEPLAFPDNCNLNCIPAQVLKMNYNLALALAEAWIQSSKSNDRDKKFVFKKDKIHLKDWTWPGRFQIIKGETNVDYYLDGAHTVESMEICVQWFAQKTLNSKNEKVLVFNVTGSRNAEKLLDILSSYTFDRVFFTPNVGRSTTIKPEVIHQLSATGAAQDVLFTGSLHLVGAALTVLDPQQKTIT